MKKWQILAWGTFLLTFVFMIAAVKNFQDDQDEPFLNTFPFHFSIDWYMTSLNGAGARPQAYDHILETVEDAVAAGNCQKVNLPYQGRSSSDDIIVFKTMLPEECPGLTLRFVSMNTAICVFMDKEQIYKYGFLPNGTPAEVIEKSEHTIYIPNVSENSELWIVQASAYPNAAATLNNVEINTQGSLVINVIGNNITDVGCCLLIMLMAFLFFVLALIRKYTHQPARGEMYLGLVCIAAGIDCIIATDTLSIFYNIHAAYAMPEYLKLIVALFLAMYFEQSLSAIYPRRYSVLLVSVLFSVWLQLVLNASGLQNIPEITILKLFTSGAICLTAVSGLIQFFHSHRYRRILPAAAAVCILLVGEIAGIVLTNINQLIFYQYSITIFSILMAVVHVLQLSREYRENVEKSAHLLEEELKVIERQNQQLARAKQDADAARHEAMAANESKGKFLAHMSHEIRTPINAVLGMDEMILRESKEPGIKEYAMDIYTAGQTLLSLINDILDFSKIESGKMEIVPVIYDPGSLIHDLTNITTQQAKSKDIRFEVSVDPNIPCQLYGDDVRIRQVLTNILTNAVKYTHEGTVWLALLRK